MSHTERPLLPTRTLKIAPQFPDDEPFEVQDVPLPVVIDEYDRRVVCEGLDASDEGVSRARGDLVRFVEIARETTRGTYMTQPSAEHWLKHALAAAKEGAWRPLSAEVTTYSDDDQAES
jgi:hypothetical protein